MAQENKPEKVVFPDGTVQSTAAMSRHYASIQIAVGSVTDFIVTIGAFSPPLPAGTTVVPEIEASVGKFSVITAAATTVNTEQLGILHYPGAPFGGTNTPTGIYRDVDINDHITMAGQVNGPGGTATINFIAYMPGE